MSGVAWIARWSRPGRVVRRSARGQAMVEFALAIPLLLLITLVTIDVARVFYDYISLRTAAMDGALYGSRFPSDDAGIRQRVTDHFLPNGLPGGTGIVPSVDPICKGTGSLGQTGFASVTVTRAFSPVSLRALQFLKPGTTWSFTISTTAKTRCMT